MSTARSSPTFGLLLPSYYDPATGEVLWEENSQDRRSIASITKVMTAVVFLESAPNLSQQTKSAQRYARGIHHILENERHGSLRGPLASPVDPIGQRGGAHAGACLAARIDGFIQRMNEKAFELGLMNTSYTDPSGLDSKNISSAYDMARLIAHAAEDPQIGPIMRTAESSFHTTAKRLVTVRSTNQLVRAGDVDVRGGKTGFIRSPDIAWRRSFVYPKAVRRLRSSCSGRPPASAVFRRSATWSAGCPPRSKASA